MGLVVSVGMLGRSRNEPEYQDWLRGQLREINRVLAAHNLPPHDEPETLPPRGPYTNGGDLPYGWFHYLRRAVAYARQAPGEFRPVARGESPEEDKRLRKEYAIAVDSHIICHSDCEGFYVPVDFPSPLDDEEVRLCGGQLGSSVRALRELVQVAPLLGIPLRGGKLSANQASAIAAEQEGAHPLEIEGKVWLELFQAFGQSIARKSAVVFR